MGEIKVDKKPGVILGCELQRTGSYNGSVPGPGGLMVQSIRDGGLIQEWNNEQPPEASLVEAQHHCVVEVGGVRGTPNALLDTLKIADPLYLKLIRIPEWREATFTRSESTPPKPLGLGLVKVSQEGTIGAMVRMVQEGVIRDHGEANPNEALQRGDVVVEVNGTIGNSDEL